MEREEYNKLNPGDHVWVCRLRFSTAGNLSLSMLAELEKIEGRVMVRHKIVALSI